ncbi:MAG: sodium transport system ATP-binding protein [Phenylobacterium sp.]|jgi:sodium transport system ATP-binding protein
MLQVKNLQKSFGQLKALDGLSFAADDQQITGILGPNGAGKTTCLRTLFGLLQPDCGEVMVDNINVLENPLEARRKIGIFPDKFGLYERLTSREQIRYFANIHGICGADCEAAIERMVTSLQLQDIIDRRAAGFSQGQRMKVALAQALVHQPKNLILDEPTRGLDVMSTRLLREILLDLKQQGHCILFSSHVMQEVAALCDRVVIVASGKIAAQGTPQELCELAGKTHLEDAFVAIIGSEEGIAA